MFCKKVKILLFFSALLFTTFASQAQNKFAYVGPSGIVGKEGESTFGVNAGLGFRMGDMLSAGINLDIFPFKSELQYGVVSGDFRFHFSKPGAAAGPYLGFRPGFVLYSKSVRAGGASVTTKGTVAIDGIAGFLKYARNKKIGFGAFVGYGFVGFKTTVAGLTSRTDVDGVKIGAHVVF